MDFGSHFIRPLRMVMGEVEEVIGIVDYPLPFMQGESLSRGPLCEIAWLLRILTLFIKAILKFKSGKYATLELTKADTFFGPQPGLLITGTKGEVTVYRKDGVTLYDKENPQGKSILGPTQCIIYIPFTRYKSFLS